MPSFIQFLKSSIRSGGHGPSQGMEPSSSVWRIFFALAFTTSYEARSRPIESIVSMSGVSRNNGRISVAKLRAIRKPPAAACRNGDEAGVVLVPNCFTYGAEGKLIITVSEKKKKAAEDRQMRSDLRWQCSGKLLDVCAKGSTVLRRGAAGLRMAAVWRPEQAALLRRD